MIDFFEGVDLHDIVRIREYPNKRGHGMADRYGLVIGAQMPTWAMILICVMCRVPHKYASYDPRGI